MKAAAIVINFPFSRSTSLRSFLLHITKVLMSAVHISSLFTKLKQNVHVLSWNSNKMKILLYTNSHTNIYEYKTFCVYVLKNIHVSNILYTEHVILYTWE